MTDTMTDAAFLRRRLSTLVVDYEAEDIIAALSVALDGYAEHIARRGGEYGRAAELSVIVKYLDGLDKFVENYDPTPE